MSQHPLPYAAIFFDADGTLRRCTVPGQPCPNSHSEWELLPNVRKTLALYNWSKIGMSICSNQGGVAFGFLSESMARRLLARLVGAAFDRWPPMGSIFLCPHAPDAGCSYRKPKPGMLLAAYQYWHDHSVFARDLAVSDCLYVGDQATDQQAAEAAGMAFMWAHEFFDWETV